MQDKDREKKPNKEGDGSKPVLVISASSIIRTLLTIAAVLVCVRLPLVFWIKFPLAIGLLIAGRYWILRSRTALQITSGPVDHFKIVEKNKNLAT